jgi:two-component system phosphate regulon sensor histidine kinase PhoR
MLQLEIASTNLIPILEESISAVQPIANKKNITINLLACSKTVNILGDNSGLQQVFINLINNATKFSPEYSSIIVKIVQLDKDIHVAITDQGLGIPVEDMPRLFDKFFRGRNVTIAEIPGSGVGLYIVKNIIQQLGGSIKVSSVLNEGTTFTVILKSTN